MVYLYAGLGVAMLAGIMAVFDMGLSLTGRSLLPTPEDPYATLEAFKAKDRQLMALLADREAVAAGLQGRSLCAGLINAYEGAYGGGHWLQDAVMPVNGGQWEGSCVLNDAAHSHRVVVIPDLADGAHPYQLYSCVLQGGNDRCSFERD